MRFQDLTGQRFGRLTVLERAVRGSTPGKKHRTYWLCECDCGNVSVVLAEGLKSGNTTSCGCYHREVVSKTIMTHKRIEDNVYLKWSAMKARCFNKNTEHYSDYGGRGITVCDRWRDSFDLFYEDVSKLPHFGEDGYSLNRIDNDGNYEPGNVEWADSVVQNNNKRNNRLVTFNDKTQTVAKWSRETGIPYNVIYKRAKLGWSLDEILTTPVRKYKTKI